MRIFHVASSFPYTTSTSGGSQSPLVEMVRQQKLAGHEVAVILPHSRYIPERPQTVGLFGFSEGILDGFRIIGLGQMIHHPPVSRQGLIAFLAWKDCFLTLADFFQDPSSELMMPKIGWRETLRKELTKIGRQKLFPELEYLMGFGNPFFEIDPAKTSFSTQQHEMMIKILTSGLMQYYFYHRSSFVGPRINNTPLIRFWGGLMSPVYKRFVAEIERLGDPAIIVYNDMGERIEVLSDELAIARQKPTEESLPSPFSMAI